jgi:hypothetical protein
MSIWGNGLKVKGSWGGGVAAPEIILWVPEPQDTHIVGAHVSQN